MGTLDTKSDAMTYLKQTIESLGFRALVMDVSVGCAGDRRLAHYSSDEILESINEKPAEISKLSRGEAVEVMCRAAQAFLWQLVRLKSAHGFIGIGGSGGTTLCSSAMMALPYGIPKILVSTLASGNTKWHVGTSDIVMVPSLLDISGLNPMLKRVLGNAASAICGMVGNAAPYVPSGRKVVSATMYGTTTPGVTAVRNGLERHGMEIWTFHATGIGGKTMERLLREGAIQGVIDMTLAEIGAHLVGGLHDGGEARMSAAIEMRVPQVVVPGAADTIVLPPRDEVPSRFRRRTLNYHNPTMTTMRTTPKENVEIATFIARKLNLSRSPTRVLLPLGGVSTIDRPGRAFFNPKANDALFSTLKKLLVPRIPVVESPYNINDPEFADLVTKAALEIM
jgi:uncharacterized protein (UPF0261 family)